MEDSTIRKIKVTLRDKESLILFLNELETGRGEVMVELEMKDTKDNYSLLTHSSRILDWDFITAERQKPEPTEGILRGIEPGDWNGVAWRIENVWKAALKSPAVLFQSDFFWKVLEQVSSSPTPEHAILVKLSEARWSGWEWKDVEEDITQILNIEWKNGMGKKSLTELSRTIYGRN
jgi:hypothetical protein